MTRINLVPPSVLTNEHLMAEYRELPRVFTRVLWRINKGQSVKDVTISENYTLNTGHENFFNDKCQWLYFRLMALKDELIKRGYNLDLVKYQEILKLAHQLKGTEWWGDYEPSPAEIYLNMARLVRRCKIDSVLQEKDATN